MSDGDWKPIKVELSYRMRWVLQRMVESGLWGRSIEQAAEWIIAEKLRKELREGRV